MELKFYTVKQLTELLHVSENWVMRKVRSGAIPSYKIEGKRLFKKEEIEQWIESRKDEPKAVAQ